MDIICFAWTMEVEEESDNVLAVMYTLTFKEAEDWVGQWLTSGHLLWWMLALNSSLVDQSAKSC